MITSPLPEKPDIPESLASRVADDYRKFQAEWPSSVEDYLLDAYGIDLASEYAGLKIKNPFGKASGQLSLATHQVEKDVESGLGFVVLKTVIAQDAGGLQSMQDWAIKETHMTVERIRGRSGREGWTVTWKGRGWHDTFESYLGLFSESLAAAGPGQVLVVPSCKYHLPAPGESSWRQEEYDFTTCALFDVWRARGPSGSPMPIEKDFSPTLAGSDHASQKDKVLEWLRTVPRLIHGAADPGAIRVGLKIFNAVFDDEFQLEMLRVAHDARNEPAEFLVYANRLFDPDREYEGKKGVAYGGPDLSERNLRVLARWRQGRHRNGLEGGGLPVSGTGDIGSGRMAVEYLLRGCSSFQLHTFFQLPDSEYGMKAGHKTRRALHEILFHPVDGFVVWISHLRRKLGWADGMNVREMADYCSAPENGIWLSG